MRRKRYPKSSRGWWVARAAGAASGRGRRAVHGAHLFCTQLKTKRSGNGALFLNMDYAYMRSVLYSVPVPVPGPACRVPRWPMRDHPRPSCVRLLY